MPHTPHTPGNASGNSGPPSVAANITQPDNVLNNSQGNNNQAMVDPSDLSFEATLGIGDDNQVS